MQVPTLAEYSQKYDYLKFEREDGQIFMRKKIVLQQR